MSQTFFSWLALFTQIFFTVVQQKNVHIIMLLTQHTSPPRQQDTLPTNKHKGSADNFTTVLQQHDSHVQQYNPTTQYDLMRSMDKAEREELERKEAEYLLKKSANRKKIQAMQQVHKVIQDDIAALALENKRLRQARLQRLLEQEKLREEETRAQLKTLQIQSNEVMQLRKTLVSKLMDMVVRDKAQAVAQETLYSDSSTRLFLSQTEILQGNFKQTKNEQPPVTNADAAATSDKKDHFATIAKRKQREQVFTEAKIAKQKLMGTFAAQFEEFCTLPRNAEYDELQQNIQEFLKPIFARRKVEQEKARKASLSMMNTIKSEYVCAQVHIFTHITFTTESLYSALKKSQKT